MCSQPDRFDLSVVVFRRVKILWGCPEIILREGHQYGYGSAVHLVFWPETLYGFEDSDCSVTGNSKGIANDRPVTREGAKVPLRHSPYRQVELPTHYHQLKKKHY